MTPAPDSPTQPPRQALGRAAFFGLSAGMIIGGLYLLFLGVRGLLGKPDCAGLSKVECDFAVEAAAHVGRVQTICGGALVALALSLFVLARPYLSPRPPPPQPRAS